MTLLSPFLYLLSRKGGRARILQRSLEQILRTLWRGHKMREGREFWVGNEGAKM